MQLTLNNSKEMKKCETALDTFCKWKHCSCLAQQFCATGSLATYFLHLWRCEQTCRCEKSFSHKQQSNTNAHSFCSSISISSFPPNMVSYRKLVVQPLLPLLFYSRTTWPEIILLVTVPSAWFFIIYRCSTAHISLRHQHCDFLTFTW